MNFKIMGVSIKVSFLLVAMLTLFSLYDRTGIAYCSILSAAMHECGHLVAALFLRLKVRELCFMPFGIGLRLKQDLSLVKTGKKLALLFAGSLVNFITFGAITLVNKGTTLFALTSLVTGVFNLLPVSSLDGGRILNELLSLSFTENTAQNIADAISLFASFALFVLGAVAVAVTGYNISLAITAIYLAVLVILRQKKLK